VHPRSVYFMSVMCSLAEMKLPGVISSPTFEQKLWIRFWNKKSFFLTIIKNRNELSTRGLFYKTFPGGSNKLECLEL
jgi:hypothetical protein